MSQRFCSTCHSFRREDGGIIRQTRVKRWICADCAIKAKSRKQPVIADFAPKKEDQDWQNWYRKSHKV